MIPLSIGNTGQLRRVLCLGAHADDIEIGCGGTILQLLAANPELEVRWIVLSASPERRHEALRSADLFLGSPNAGVSVMNFRDGFFPYTGGELKEFFESLKHEPAPDLVLTHYGQDRHQDHRTVSELTWNTFRNQLVLEYEIPKYDGDLGSPNLFVPLEARIRSRKIANLMEAFVTQHGKHWFAEETFSGLMRLRGMEAAAPEGYAEGFYARKLVVRA